MSDLSTPFDPGLVEQPSTETLDRAIADFTTHRSLGGWRTSLNFALPLERAFGDETAAYRVRELRLTVSLGLILYQATGITDPIFVPDIGWAGVLFRLLGSIPILICLGLAPRLSSAARESLAAAGALVVLLFSILVPAVSASPLAPFAFATVSLGLNYVNTSFPLRFDRACLTTAVTTACIALAVWIRRDLTAGLAFALTLQALVAAACSLIADYRIERNLRLNYLLAAREKRRLADIIVEREALSILSQTDKLTGLANRLYLDRESADLFDNASNHGLPVGLLMIDVDHFKRFNDHYGHGAGDVCLQAIADTFSSRLNREDLAVRFGGEEFIVLLRNKPVEQVDAIARGLRDAVAGRLLEHANREDGLSIVTVSIGVAHTIVGAGLTFGELLEQADLALYAAKKRGRNQIADYQLLAA